MLVSVFFIAIVSKVASFYTVMCGFNSVGICAGTLSNGRGVHSELWVTINYYHYDPDKPQEEPVKERDDSMDVIAQSHYSWLYMNRCFEQEATECLVHFVAQ